MAFGGNFEPRKFLPVEPRGDEVVAANGRFGPLKQPQSHHFALHRRLERRHRLRVGQPQQAGAVHAQQNITFLCDKISNSFEK